MHSKTDDNVSFEALAEASRYHMPFGKHRGKVLGEIPLGYLKWLHDLPELREPLKTNLLNELKRRRNLRAQQLEEDGPLGIPANELRDEYCEYCGSEERLTRPGRPGRLASRRTCRYCGHKLKSHIK